MILSIYKIVKNKIVDYEHATLVTVLRKTAEHCFICNALIYIRDCQFLRIQSNWSTGDKLVTTLETAQSRLVNCWIITRVQHQETHLHNGFIHLTAVLQLFKRMVTTWHQLIQCDAKWKDISLKRIHELSCTKIQ